MDKPQMKPVEKTDEDVSDALVNTRNKNGSVALAVNQINSFEQAEALADWIAQSPVFNKGFKEQVQKEDGTSEAICNGRTNQSGQGGEHAGFFTAPPA